MQKHTIPSKVNSKACMMEKSQNKPSLQNERLEMPNTTSSLEDDFKENNLDIIHKWMK